MIHQQDLLPLLVMALFVWGLALVVLYFIRLERKLAAIWEVVAEGEFDRVEYGYHEYTRRTGAMVHTTHHYREWLTTVHFCDGRSIVAHGRHSLPYPKGTCLRVWRNKIDDYKIEVI